MLLRTIYRIPQNRQIVTKLTLKVPYGAFNQENYSQKEGMLGHLTEPLELPILPYSLSYRDKVNTFNRLTGGSVAKFVLN